MNASEAITPSVSVLIAAYNAADFLHSSVSSALEQTYPPFEVLVVDDGSTDATLEVARSLQSSDARIRIIALQENSGPSRARNAGIDAAQGEWIAILDADDRFAHDHLEVLVRATKNGADVVAGNFEYYSPPEDRFMPSGIPVMDTYEPIDIYCFTERARSYSQESDWGLLQPMLNRHFLNKNELRYPTFSQHGEDFLFMMYTLLAGARFILSRKVGYFYTIHSGSSRTCVNYEAMWVHSNELLANPRVATDARLSSLLQQRISTIKRLNAERRFDHFRRIRDNVALVTASFTNVYFFLESIRRITNKCQVFFQYFVDTANSLRDKKNGSS